MFAWWKRRAALKQAREVVKNTRKLLRMHRDIIAPADVQAVRGAADDLAGAVKAGNAGALENLTGKLDEKFGKALPRQSFPALRENIEVFLVAAIVAMGVRTFFIQPFKIPTGSMQPTLYGIVASDQCADQTSLLGRLQSGIVHGSWPQHPNASMASSITDFFSWVLSGQSAFDAVCLFSGDHIMVDRFTYHFRKPQRGEVIVFDTSEIDRLPEGSRGKFYIKRLIGLGGDTIQIQPPYVYVNDKKLDSRPAFERIYSCTNGYHGYVVIPGAEFIHNPGNIYQVPAQSLFVLGDNSRSSLDGRFWGSLPDRALVGRAFMVYWPFTRRFGLID